MSINLEGIKGRFFDHYQIVSEYGIQFGHDVMKIGKKTLDRVQQDPRLAAATLVVSNIIFLEVSLRICGKVSELFNCYIINDDELGKNSILAKSIAVLLLFSGLIGAMNVGISKGLKLPFSPMQVAAISVASCASYALFRVWFAKPE